MRRQAAAIMCRHWTRWGYAVPHPRAYPFQWLWDSCFHSIIWAELGDERAGIELESIFRHQHSDGFVPHMTYDADPHRDRSLWGRAHTSSITQPPMYGHAAAELVRRGFDVPEYVLDRCTRGLRFLLHRRPRIEGLVSICHPWESGCDDSPRWDSWLGSTGQPELRWQRKGDLVATVARDATGSAVGNTNFAVSPASFNALVAFNAFELAAVTADEALAADAAELAARLAETWDPFLRTWVDQVTSPVASSAIRTLDSLLPALVCGRLLPDDLEDSLGFGAPNGPRGCHLAEASYEPSVYWRGSAWPQLVYLLAVAAARSGEIARAERLRSQLRRSVVASGFAEHWNPETGGGLGAAPYGWSALAIVGPVGAGGWEQSPIQGEFGRGKSA